MTCGPRVSASARRTRLGAYAASRRGCWSAVSGSPSVFRLDDRSPRKRAAPTAVETVSPPNSHDRRSRRADPGTPRKAHPFARLTSASDFLPRLAPERFSCSDVSPRNSPVLLNRSSAPYYAWCEVDREPLSRTALRRPALGGQTPPRSEMPGRIPACPAPCGRSASCSPSPCRCPTVTRRLTARPTYSLRRAGIPVSLLPGPPGRNCPSRHPRNA